MTAKDGASAVPKRNVALSTPHPGAEVRIDKILFLGTGAAVPVPGQRNMSSLAVLLSTGSAIMVDCGEGTQHHIKASTFLKTARLEAILLTHLHGDHCFGLFGLLNTMASDGRKDPVLIVGPEGVQQMVEATFRPAGGWNLEEGFPLVFKEIPSCQPSGDLRGPAGKGFLSEHCRKAAPVALDDWAGMKLQAVPMVHSVPDWGYIITEPDRPGALDVAKAIELGVPKKSPMLGQLKSGKSVTVASGAVIQPEQVLKPSVSGRRVAVLQDTCDACAAIEPCRSAACVIHEATFEETMTVEALAKGHSTSSMAADFAAACGARRLVLTHFSARYSLSSSDATGSDPAERLGMEARRKLGPDGPPVVVARDFMVLRGDRNFEPDQALAVKRPPWHRLPTGDAVSKHCGEGCA